jgi:hypothetical protein
MSGKLTIIKTLTPPAAPLSQLGRGVGGEGKRIKVIQTDMI